MNVRFRMSVVLLLAAVLSTGPGRAEDRPGTGGELPRLNMEELEVRGKRGNPDVLYFPVPAEIYRMSPVRLDLIREEVVRPLEEAKSP